MARRGDLKSAPLLDPDDESRCVVITDPSLPDNPIVHVSDEFVRFTGYSAKETLGRNCRFLQGPGTDPAAIQAIREAIAARTELTIDILNYRKDGTPFWNRLRMCPLYDERGHLVYFAASQNPIRERDMLSRPVEALFD